MSGFVEGAIAFFALGSLAASIVGVMMIIDGLEYKDDKRK